MSKMFAMEDIAVIDERRVYRSLSLTADPVNVLVQVRRTIPSVEEQGRMVDSFLEQGQLVPGIVAVLTRAQAVKYLMRINFLWKTTYVLRDLKQVSIEGKGHYFILVAGHMRYATGLKLIDMHRTGALSSLRKFDGRYYAELRFGLSADEAVKIQINENIRNHLHTADEAYAAWLVWEWQRSLNPKFTKTQLANMFARSTSWVDDALLFAELPDSVQDLALPSGDKKPMVLRPVLIEIAYLKRQMEKVGRVMSDEDLMYEIAVVVAEGLKPEQIRVRTQERLKHLTGNAGEQVTMDLLEGFEQANVSTRRLIRRVAAPQVTRAALAGLTWLRQLRILRESGVFGDESPYDPETSASRRNEYSTGSPIRLTGRLAELFQQEASHWVMLAARDGGRGRPMIVNNLPGVEAAATALAQLEKVESEM